MPVNKEAIRQRLRAFDLEGVMVEELGWDALLDSPMYCPVDGFTYTLHSVAQKRGMVVYVCSPDEHGRIPSYPLKQKIERQVARNATFEHLIIFTDGKQREQEWQWVKRRSGKPAAWRHQVFRPYETEERLLQKLQGIAFELDEEESLGLVNVTRRVGRQFDVDRVTKRFYDRFKKEHDSFLGFVEGIEVRADREWYASLMLNRLMFVYFIQKKGFLDGDIHYLRNRLSMTQSKAGADRFHQFYRMFLLRLFHEGLAQPQAKWNPDLADLLGDVPYLNGGMFDVHELERQYPDIEIPDEAFAKIFDFFDAYDWHLDDRPLRADNEINPDVLGYIFEKYVNQKQMGAYYTKEDITGYISRNTIIPYLFSAAKKLYPTAFKPDGEVWKLLKDDPDRYIYPAVRKGTDQPLPDEIAAGLNDVSKRGGWNRPASEEHALPTETWREHVARRQRYEEVRAKLADGKVTDINDLVTLNLDICQFAEDVIINSDGPDLMNAFWRAMEGLSVLDPTCGSGAFLFAALNIMEPLYNACLEGMQGFLDDLERSGEKQHPRKLGHFRKVLVQVAHHFDRRYFVLKSIVVNNLYGVDIMEEAVEICKLRLFLKLVAQVEDASQLHPLPDIDFNIKAGNTLVGFTSVDAVRDAMTMMPNGQHRLLSTEDQEALDQIDEDAGLADTAFGLFRLMQTDHRMDSNEFREAKADLRERLNRLREELDTLLARVYGVEPSEKDRYHAWRTSHQPFHWFTEFYGIMRDGGFTVIIGNPPWREYSAVKKEYQVIEYETESCGNLYALCSERSAKLTSNEGWFSFIVQLPFVSSSRMAKFRELLLGHSSNFYYIPFDDRPGKLFNGLQHCRSVVFLSQKQVNKTRCSVYSSKYQRWASTARNCLFAGIEFVHVADVSVHRNKFPKMANNFQVSLLTRLHDNAGHSVFHYINPRPTKQFVFYQEAMQYWAKVTFGLPYYSKNGVKGAPAHGRYLYADDVGLAHRVSAILNSSLFYVYFIAYGDCFHLSATLAHNFPLVAEIVEDDDLVLANQSLMSELHQAAEIKTINTKDGDSITYEEFFAGNSKMIIDEIDGILARHYGFTDEELDFIINYDIKYRIGVDAGK